MFQIAEGIEPNQQKAEGGNGHKELGDAVQLQGDGQRLGHGKQHQLPLRQEQGVGGQHRFQSQRRSDAAVLVLLCFQEGKHQRRQGGE